jgi:hypothetical protein
MINQDLQETKINEALVKATNSISVVYTYMYQKMVRSSLKKNPKNRRPRGHVVHPSHRGQLFYVNTCKISFPPSCFTLSMGA